MFIFFCFFKWLLFHSIVRSAIVVEKTEEKLKEENPSTHDPSTSLLTTEFVNACFHVDKTAKAEIYLNKV